MRSGRPDARTCNCKARRHHYCRENSCGTHTHFLSLVSPHRLRRDLPEVHPDHCTTDPKFENVSDAPLITPKIATAAPPRAPVCELPNIPGV